MSKKCTPVVVANNEVTFRSCATEAFRWVRTGIRVVEASPAFVKGLGEDLVKAWEDSAKS